jgi:FkbM family methyltransferase
MLLHLRSATVRIKRIPGSVLALGLIRRYFFRRPLSLRVNDFDGGLAINLRLDEHMQSQIFWYGSYSRDVLLVIQRLLRPGMVVVDAGANIGEITLASAKRVGPLGRVYAFEPVPELADALTQNVRLNDFRQVSVERQGLSSERGNQKIYRASSHFDDGSRHEGLATLYPSGQRGSVIGEIRLITLDDFCQESGVSRLDLIKLDVEGAELPVLKGATKTLLRFKPHIIVEVQQSTANQAGYHATDILSFVRSLGYRFDVIARGGRLRPVHEGSLTRFQNILCSPVTEK